MAYDVVITGGTVIDGTGAPRRRADVGIRDGRIAAIAAPGRLDESGRTSIDADGQFVAPGFIDGHTHYDAQLFWDPLGTSSCWHGVTTVVMGNCGFTLAPCREAEADLVLRSLERAEDMSRDALLAGVRWQWETYPEYVDVIERLPKGLNVAGYIGHSALRTHVMGQRAYDEAASDDDLSTMRAIVIEAMQAGALGLSTSRSMNHATSDDRPVPSRLANWREIQVLVGALGEVGRGVFQLAAEHHPDDDSYAEYNDRLRHLSASTGRPITFLSAATRQKVEAMTDLNRDGARAFVQVHCRNFMTTLGFKAGLPFDQLPQWRELRALPLDAQAAALRDPARRAALVEAAMHGTFRDDAIGAEVRPPDYEHLQVLDDWLGARPSVAELARERDTTPVDVIIDESLEHHFERFFTQPLGYASDKLVLAAMRHPNSVIAASDSGAHVSQLIDASIPTYVLGYWVRQREELTWEEGVKMLTGDPAAAWGFTDRGVMEVGRAADVTIFDPSTIAPDLPSVAHDFPTGVRRLVQRARGINATLVNGEVLIRDGVPTGALPGRFLRTTG